MSGFPPPPGQGFPPPPGQQQPPNNKFPPPNQGAFPPPPAPAQPQQPGIGFAPPPAPTNQLNQAMGSMSIQANTPAQAATSFAPPPPAGFSGQPGPPAASNGPKMFTPGAPPPPGASNAAPHMMQPPAPSASAPQMMQVPGQFGHQPPPPGHPQPPAPQGAAAPFYPQQPSAPQMQRAVAPGASTAPGGMPAPFQENIDFSIEIPERLCLFTTKKIPQTAGMANSSKVPVGAIIRPLAPAMCEEDEVDVVQPGNAGIIRCKRCRTYINAFVTWLENGRRWRCNICAQLNDCPSTYFCHLDEQGHRRDRLQRPELSKGVVEFIAPTEYMVRPPQEPAYFFVLDVSATAVRSGMLHSAAAAIRQSLDDLPGKGRTKIGFITYDNSVHYYNLAPDLSNPQMMVVSDLKELFVPLPEHLLVNLKESRGVVEAFLDNLPDMFVKNPVVSQSCLGPALKAAFTVVKSIGGKMSVFQAIQPNLGDGSLKPRENHALMGTPNEVKLLRPDVSWYKDTAVEFSRQQISVDMYLFPYQYMDLAALGELPRYTAGTLKSYASFNHEKDGPRFEAELNKALTQQTAFEAVMRIRCTKGMRITNFYGNFYIRGTDLLALPNCNTDSVFGFDLAHDEQNVPSSVVTVQAALLYTSSDGERRIRVMTQALPVTSLTSELMASVDTDSVCNLLSKQALELCNKTTLDNARMRLQQTCVEMMRAAKGGDKRTVSGYTVPPSGPQAQADGEEKPIPENLALLPLNTLALMKNVAFRGGTDVHPDERTQSHHLLNTMWVEKSRDFIYPRMFSIHDMEDAAGLPSEGNVDDESDDHFAGRDNILLPQSVNLSVERLTSDGIFLLDNGVEMNLWVGRSADPILLQALFGTNTLDNVDMSQITLNTSGDDFASRLGSIMQALREDEADMFVIPPKVNIVREGDARMEARFFWYLIEDRASFQGGTYSYAEFMEFVKNPGAGAGRGPPGPGPPGGMVGRGPPGPPQGMPGQGMPPPGPPQPIPQQHHGMPPGAPGNYPPQAPPPPQQGMPPGPPGTYSQPPPPQQHGMPQPHQGPPSGGYGAPRAAPPGPPHSGSYGQPPMQGPPSGGQPPMQGPPSGGQPPMQGPPSGGYPGNAMPPGPPARPGSVQQGPPSGGYSHGAPPPPARQAHPPPPGPPGSRMPPPPPQYR